MSLWWYRKPQCELNIFCVLTTTESRRIVGTSKLHLIPPVVRAADHSEALVLLLLIYLLPLCMGVLCFGPCFVIQYFVSFLFCSHLDREERDDCFTVFVFMMFCGSQSSVALLHGAIGWSAVCDCDIS